MKYKLGIDVGISGALALLDEENRCLASVDMPVMLMTNKRQQVNAAELGKMIDLYRRKHGDFLTAYVEAVHSMPGQGVSGMFNFGVSYGIVQGILGALQIPMVLVSPVSWKRRAGLLGTEKDKARSFAIQLYPDVDLSKKKHGGRADAILIARFSGLEKD